MVEKGDQELVAEEVAEEVEKGMPQASPEAWRSLEIARERGWTIVSMRDDWKSVYDVEQ